MSQVKAILDKLLSNVSSAYIPTGYIAESVLPFIGSVQSTGKLGKYGASHLRIESSLKAGRGAYKRVESITRSTTDYSIVGHGLEGLVTKDDYRNVSLPFKAEEDETLGVTTMLWLEKEKSLADTLADSSVMTQYTTLTGTNQYNDFLNSDPISDFSTARTAVRTGCGQLANTGIMDWAVFNKLRYHPGILDALGFKQNRPGGLSEDELASAMGVQRILIAGSSYNSAKENQADVLAPVWGKHIIFAVLPPVAMPYQVSLGYIVGYEGQTPRKVTKQPNFNPPDSTSILVEDEYQMLISNANAGYLIKNAIA